MEKRRKIIDHEPDEQSFSSPHFLTNVFFFFPLLLLLLLFFVKEMRVTDNLNKGTVIVVNFPLERSAIDPFRKSGQPYEPESGRSRLNTYRKAV